MWGLGFGLGEQGRTVLSEAVLDLAALKGAATDNLGEETSSGERKECQETEQGCGFGLDKRGIEVAACIAMEHCGDFGNSTGRYSAEGRAREIEIGTRVKVAIATEASIEKEN